jgi:hypothetical protein
MRGVGGKLDAGLAWTRPARQRGSDHDATWRIRGKRRRDLAADGAEADEPQTQRHAHCAAAARDARASPRSIIPRMPRGMKMMKSTSSTP